MECLIFSYGWYVGLPYSVPNSGCQGFSNFPIYVCDVMVNGKFDLESSWKTPVCWLVAPKEQLHTRGSWHNSAQRETPNSWKPLRGSFSSQFVLFVTKNIFSKSWIIQPGTSDNQTLIYFTKWSWPLTLIHLNLINAFCCPKYFPSLI